MTEWKKVLIKDLGRTVTGHTPPTKEKKYYGDFMPFVKPTDISKDSKFTYHPEQYYSREAAEKYKNSLIPQGATCVVCIGTIGEKMTMAHCDLFTNQSINSIIPSDDYDPEFVYYLLKYNLGKVKSLNKGTASGREFVSKSTFLDMPVMVCKDKKEQIEIGKILSRYDSLIENYQQQIKLLEEAAQRLYKEWFVDLHFPGYENTKIVDGVPEGWVKKELDEFADVVMGQSPKSIYYNNEHKGIPFHQGVGSYGNRFVVNSTYTTVYNRVAEANSILFSVRAPVGRLNITKERIAIGRGLASINHKDGFQSFLFYMLKERFFKDNIIGNGSIFASISKDDLLGLKFIIPSYNLVKEFNGLAASIDSCINRLSSQIRLLTEARDRLLPKLMSGEVEIGQ